MGGARWPVLAGDPAVAISNDGAAYVVARGANNQYYLIRYSLGSGFGAWTSLLGLWSSDPAVTASPAGETVHVAGRDTYNGIWTGEYRLSSGWQGWNPRGGVTRGRPAVAVDRDGAVYVAVRDSYNSAWMLTSRLGWAWSYGGGIFSSDLNIAADAVRDKIRVAALDSWYSLYTADFDLGGAWGGWAWRLGVVEAMTASQVNGRLYVYAYDSSNRDWRYSLEDDHWEPLEGVVYGQPKAAP